MNIFYRPGEKALSKVPSRSARPWLLPRDSNDSAYCSVSWRAAASGEIRSADLLKNFVRPRFWKLNVPDVEFPYEKASLNFRSVRRYRKFFIRVDFQATWKEPRLNYSFERINFRILCQFSESVG